MSENAGRRAVVVGAGLIGGSVGFGLRRLGWYVTAHDVDADTAATAVSMGAADTVGFDTDADLVVIATPVGAVAEVALDALERTSAVVTDVGSTKADICAAVDHPRFIGGHPMAGSEQDGIAGAHDGLFQGAMWVLTPTGDTDETAFARVRAIVRALGAETIALQPAAHDEIVALVSHVPHLTAATLMNVADGASIEHRALLRLAAGGFRDMTRISAGRPSIWPDICMANRTAIVDGLEQMIDALSTARDLVAKQDRDGIHDLLTSARSARINLPVGFGPAEHLVEVAVPIPDQPGEIAAIATLAAELDVNIFDLEITHSGEGRRGVMLLVVDEARSERFMGGLMARSYRPTVRSLD
ncbi:MAG: prephenate dehydrogenase/arogenate dehydrogenase family protein [Actinomycetota bacterium]